MFNISWQKEPPKKCVLAICKGRSSFGEWHEDNQYFIATYMAYWPNPIWIAGKQQEECEVEEYFPIEEFL
jgi:hypothetical protein